MSESETRTSASTGPWLMIACRSPEFSDVFGAIERSGRVRHHRADGAIPNHGDLARRGSSMNDPLPEPLLPPSAL